LPELEEIMGFNEKVHAYIAARFYVHLKEKFGERGVAAFLYATRCYGEQRGRRMAQRAIRDGEELDFAAYCRYREWDGTEEIRRQGDGGRSEVVCAGPDYVTHIYACPWHAKFREMGLEEAGMAYCSDLDASICRGFHPGLNYKTTQTLYTHDFCIQVVEHSGLEDGQDLTPDPANMKDFEYHCAHSYWTYRKITASIFGEEGKAVGETVLAEFAGEYGEEMAGILAGYKGTDFDVIG